jgi:hypothetical protein
MTCSLTCRRPRQPLALVALALATTLATTQATTQAGPLGAQPVRSLPQKLAQPISAAWQGQTLATALQRLTATQDIVLWLDRRVDRQQRVTAHVVDLPLEAALQQLVPTHALATCGQVLYIGPAARQLDTLVHLARAQAQQLPPRLRRRWLKAATANWPAGSEPGSLATAWLREAGLEPIEGQPIPHDLWPAQTLPPLPLTDRLVLLLVGFDLTYQIAPDGHSCQVVPIPRPLRLAAERAPRQAAPPSVQGDFTQKREGLDQKRLTLEIRNQPVGKVLDQLAQTLGLEIRWQQGVAQTARVSCRVHEATLEELLEALLTPIDLRYQRTGQQLLIQFPKKRSSLPE